MSTLTNGTLKVHRKKWFIALGIIAALIVVALVVIPIYSGRLPTPVVGSDPLLLPDVMGSVGDSLSDRPVEAESWTTGTLPTVNSIFSRLQAARGTDIVTAKEAVGGSTSESLSKQMTRAIEADADLITVLMGANDACAPTLEGMTSVETFRSRYSDALSLAQAADRKVVAASVPNLYTLWEAGKDNTKAQKAWSRNSCQNMLGNPTSTSQADEDRRQGVKQRIEDYNAAIKAECALRSGCSYDGGAVYAFDIEISDLQSDYFHPNESGQAKLATAVWPAVVALYPNILSR